MPFLVPHYLTIILIMTLLTHLIFFSLAQAVTAVQFICEESLMNSPETTLDPVALVGFEGLWGLLYVMLGHL